MIYGIGFPEKAIYEQYMATMGGFDGRQKIFWRYKLNCAIAIRSEERLFGRRLLDEMLNENNKNVGFGIVEYGKKVKERKTNKFPGGDQTHY